MTKTPPVPDDPLLDAALKTFAHYGPRKTTMTDVAQAAGVSRQTLYARFSNKDGILEAAMAYLTEQILARTAQAWEQPGSLSDKLWAYFEHTTLSVYRMVQAAPDAEELMWGAGPAVRAAADAAAARKAHALTNLLEPYADQLRHKGQSPEALGRFIADTAMHLKHNAESEETLIRDLTILRQLVIEFVGGS